MGEGKKEVEGGSGGSKWQKEEGAGSSGRLMGLVPSANPARGQRGRSG